MRLRLWISLALAAPLTGCSMTQEGVLPTEGPTMKQTWDEHFQQAPVADDRFGGMAQSRPGHIDLTGYSRDAYNETQALFPTLPNPTLVMYVFPHVTGPEQLVVPGYATPIKMYLRDYQALPGEVAP